jgi:hypothetical protein
LTDRPPSGAVGVLGGIDAAQHLLEVVFDGFVAKTSL